MNENIDNNGYEYVDLGLPSGALWATMNIGASKPSDSGLYFQWGDTIGCTKEQVGKEKQFNWSDCKWRLSGDSYSGIAFTKYTTEGATLDLEDDAAHANMGGDWHMPKPTQIRELIDETTNTWTTQDGVYGRLFTSKNDSSKSIFIPAVGRAWDGSLNGRGSNGSVWSSVLSPNNVRLGQYLFFNSSNVYLSIYYRYNGLPVRGVIG